MEQKQDRFWSLLKPEHLKVRAFCRKLAGSRDDGDDLYQDALVTAYARFADLNDVGAFRSWLYRIVVNTFKNRVRQGRYKYETGLTDEMAEMTSGSDPAPMYAARRRLETALSALAPPERVLITLFELQGWRIDELAGLFDVSTSAIKVRLHRTRKKMRRALARAAKEGVPAGAIRRKTEGDICVANKPGEN